MFQTTSLARHSIMSEIAGEDEDVWNFVTLAVNAPWFFATYQDEIEGTILRSNVMLSTYQQVADILKQQNKSFKVTDLLLATPGFVNKSESWRLEPLEEVMIGIDPKTRFRYSVFKLTNGTCYFDCPSDCESPTKNNLQAVVKFSRQSHGSSQNIP